MKPRWPTGVAVALLMQAQAAMPLAPDASVAGERGATTKIVITLDAESIEFPPGDPRARRMFSTEPFDPGNLTRLEFELALKAGALRVGKEQLRNVTARVTLHDGRARLESLQGTLGGGKLSATAELDIAAKIPGFALAVDGADIQLGELDAFRGFVAGAPATLSLQVQGSGHSPAAIAGSAQGSVLIRVGGGTINNDKVNLAGADLLTELVETVNPFSRKQSASALECAVVKLSITDGVARAHNGFAVETSKMYLLGAGLIDLKSERLDIGVKPTARKGIGLGAGALAPFVRIGGTLSEPRVTPGTGNVAGAGARVGAAIATGGLSVLAEGLLSRAGSAPPCGLALAATPEATAANDEQTSSGPAAPVKKLLYGVKGILGGD